MRSICGRSDAGVWLADPEALHLERTLASGQTFRWRWETSADGGNTAVGVVGRHALCLRHDDRGLWLLSPRTAAARGLLIDYFGLARPGGGIRAFEAALAGDAILAGVLAHTRPVGDPDLLHNLREQQHPENQPVDRPLGAGAG
jgi:hypothetical protein